MSEIAVRVEHVSKEYRLGVIGHDTLRKALSTKWAIIIGKEDPNAIVGARVFDANEKFVALDDVSFEVKQGSVLGIIGRNGAGKSTLLKILSRITAPTKGRICVNGRLASLLEVGTGFHPELTGRENIYLNGAILGMKKHEIEKRFDEIVDFAEIEKFIDTPVKRYSSGMYVRLAFAVAAHLESEIMILDEVLAVGDAQFQKKCLGKMSDVSKNTGRTILFVSHNMSAIKNLCDKTILLDKGKLALYGNTIDVIQKYSNIENQYNEVQWNEALQTPQNHSAILQKVFLCKETEGSRLHFTTDDDIFIQIQYNTKYTNAVVGFTLLFYDSESNLIFSSIDNRQIDWYSKPLPLGTFITKCKIPKCWLNNGHYRIGLNIFSSNYTDLSHYENIIDVKIEDGNLVSGDYHGGYGGVLRPDLEWQTKILELK